MGQVNSVYQHNNSRLIDGDRVQLFDSEITDQSDDAILDYNVNCLMNSTNDNFENRSFRKLSKLRKSLSECFKVKHKRFDDGIITDDDTDETYSRTPHTPNNSSNNSTPVATNNNTPLHKPRPQSVAYIPCNYNYSANESVLVVDTRLAQQSPRHLETNPNHFGERGVMCRMCEISEDNRKDISHDIRDVYTKLIQLQELLIKPNERKRTVRSSESDASAPCHLPSTLDHNSHTVVSSPQLELSRHQHLLEEFRRENAQLRAALASRNELDIDKASIKQLMPFLTNLQPGHVISQEDQQYIHRLSQLIPTQTNRRALQQTPPPQTIAVVNPHRVEKSSTKMNLKFQDDQHDNVALTSDNTQSVSSS